MPSRGEPVDLLKWRRALRHPNGPRSPIVRHVLLTLATWGDSQGGSMFPGTETLAVATALARNTVAKALKTAIADGWVDRSERNRHGPYGKPRFCYEATVPAGWAYEHDVDHPWETDPTWTSERRNRGRLSQMSRLDVPHHAGDIKSSGISAGSVAPSRCPPSDETMSPTSERLTPISRTVVPHLTTVCPPPGEHDLLMTSSVTSSVTSSHEGALARTARVGTEIEKQKRLRAKPAPIPAKPNGSATSAIAPEVSRERKPERRKPTAEQGRRFMQALIDQGDDARTAADHARRAGYPVDETQPSR